MKAEKPVLLAVVIPALALVVAAISACGEDAAETTTTTAAEMTTTSVSVAELSYTTVSPEEAKTLIDTTPNLVILDVGRGYDQGHLPRAIDATDLMEFVALADIIGYETISLQGCWENVKATMV